MAVRTMRVRSAARPRPRVTAGRMRCVKKARPEPEPETGSQPSLMEKRMMRIGPRAKFGKDSPTRERTPVVRSCQRSRWVADQTPAGMAIARPMKRAASERARV
jgi:hypothetical protein